MSSHPKNELHVLPMPRSSLRIVQKAIIIPIIKQNPYPIQLGYFCILPDPDFPFKCVDIFYPYRRQKERASSVHHCDVFTPNPILLVTLQIVYDKLKERVAGSGA
jgi:hypothetical protein